MLTPTGLLTLPLANLRTLLAASAAWQSWTGAGSPAAAAERIYLIGLFPLARSFTLAELQAMRPFAVVDLWTPPGGYGGEPWKSDRVAESAYQDAGKLTLDLVDEVAPEDANDIATAKLRFLNDCGSVLSDMQNLSGTDAYLTVHRFELFQGPVRCDPDVVAVQGDFYRAQFIVHWGI